MSLIITQPVALELTISSETPEFQGLTTESSFILADVALTTANQFYQVTTVSLSAGTWLIMSQCQFYASAAGATSYTMRIVNSTSGATLAESSSMHPSQVGGVANANVSAIVTLTATTTITMQATASVNTRAVRYNAFPGGTNSATGICAVKVSA
jgi:hypothetical protein